MALLYLTVLIAVFKYTTGQGIFPVDPIFPTDTGDGICENPAGPTNGEVRWSRTPDRSEMSATYTCNGDHRLVGPSARTCQNGVWTPPEEPICEPLTTPGPACPVPQVPENGNVRYTRLDGRPTQATYECFRPECTLIGPSERNCQNGQWVPIQEPRCVCPLIRQPAQPSDPCQPSPCLNNGDCISSGLIISASPGQNFFCFCRGGYTGATCQIPPAAAPTSPPVPVNPCLSSPCQNGGNCRSQTNGYLCSCPRGYTGFNCERFIDPCQSNQCQNRAQCVLSLSTARGYTCSCQPFYTGELCQQRIAANPCLVSLCRNGATCVRNQALSIGFECRCFPGFSGQFCSQQVNPCNSNPCRNGAQCQRSGSNYRCLCSSGFTGTNCERRVQVPTLAPIQRPDIVITPSRLSVRTTGTAVLSCRYTGNRVVTSIRWSRQDGRPFDTAVIPVNNGQLIFFTPPASAGGVHVCTVQYVGGFETLTANVVIGGGEPVNPCNSNPCRNGAQCQTFGSAYRCVIVPVNPCNPNPCRNGGQCQTSGSNYRCLCRSGFTGTNCGQRVQINPCNSNPCQNGGLCQTSGGVYRCQCREGFTGPNCRQRVQVTPSGSLQVVVSPSQAVRQPTNSTALFCQAQGLPAGYAVTSTTWTRTNGRPLPSGRSQQYTGNSYLFISKHESADSGGYRCSMEATDILGNTITGSAVADITITNIGIRISPESAYRQVGGFIQFECSVEGVTGGQQPTWRRQNSTRRYQSGRYLTLRNVQASDTDQYYCEMGGLKATATLGVGLSESSSMCIAENGRTMQQGEYAYVNGSETIREARISPAADFVFLVDESGSMIQEHAWLEDVSAGLDRTLRREGIGTDIPNQFCLVGFAHPPFVTGRVIRMASGDIMGDAREFDEARKGLEIDGRIEDMYAAMNLGFEQCQLRPGMACQVIGVTDEGRSSLVTDNFETMLEKLNDRSCILNVGVNQKMLSDGPDGPITALGVSSRNDSAIEQPGGTFEIVRGKGQAQGISGHGNTHEAYVKLAFRTGGAAWDLNELRKGGDTATSFTEAFIDIKVREISNQVCQLCECDGGPLPTCTRGCLGEPPFVDASGPTEIPAGDEVEIICIPAGGRPVPDLEFKPEGGFGQLPSNYRVRQEGDSIVLTVSNVLEKFCVDCVGTNLEGEHTDQHCVDVLSEPPVVRLTGSNDGNRVPRGDPVTLTCVPLEGLPLPTLELTGPSGGRLPLGATVRQQGNSSVLFIPSLTEDICIDCTGVNVAGSDTNTLCVNVQEPPVVRLDGTHNGNPLPYGDAVTLTCIPVSGIPDPILEITPSEGFQLPPGSVRRNDGGNVQLIIPRLTEAVCFDCTGTNAAGSNVDQECLDILPERPRVDLTGSNNGRPVPYGQPVELRCVPLSGRPDPTLQIVPAAGSQLPPGTIIRPAEGLVIAIIPRLTESICFDCIGTNVAGTASDRECLEVPLERPLVDLTGSHRGQPVNVGSRVQLVCVPVTGRPDPVLTVSPSAGFSQPADTRFTTNDDGSVVVDIPRLSGDVCFNCVGVNPAGTHSDEECISVLDSCPHPRGGPNVVSGGSIRNYTSREGPTQTTVPGSAVVVFVVDESGSMRQEHEWLKRLPTIMERNLQNKNIGTTRQNEYALVGFGHAELSDPKRERGVVLQDCGTAGQVQEAVNSRLYQDGRLEDGYSAIAVGLQNLSCLEGINQRRQAGERVACQVILVTDEGRDTLSTWQYDSIRRLLGTYECVLNAAIWERFQGRRDSSEAYGLALGVSYNGQAVKPIAPNVDSYEIVPDGVAVEQTGHENTHSRYVELAFETNGAAWDLEQLRSDQYRGSFTNGFIEVKVQEIIRQIIGSCFNCTCRDGVWDCIEIGAVLGEFNCLFPQRSTAGGENREPSIAVPCCSGTPPQDVEVTWFKQGTSSSVHSGEVLTLTNREDAGSYICVASGNPFRYAQYQISHTEEGFNVQTERACTY